jgi:hypothetical protein
VIKEASEGFNNVKIQEAFADFDMSITASDKCSTLTKFVDISDATFLKRSFRHSSRFNRVLAPLDPNSIYKMCSWSIYSDNCSASDHDISVANSALTEIFIHICDRENAEELFNGIRQRFIERIKECYFIDPSGGIFTFLKCAELIA